MGVGPDKKEVRTKVRDLVDKEISLEEIKSEVASDQKLELLDAILENYVEYKYFKYLLDHVENELLSGSLYENLSPNEIKQVATEIFTARYLNELPDNIEDTCSHFGLILDEERLLSEKDRRLILSRVQVAVATSMDNVVSRVISKGDSIPVYMRMLKQHFLQVKSVVTQLNVADGSARWNAFQKKHPKVAKGYGEQFNEQQRKVHEFFVNELGNGENILETLGELTEKLREQLMEPLTWRKETKHGKKVIVFRKPYVLMSDIVKEMEKALQKFADAEEVHVVAPEAIYIDCNLTKSKWHGMNIVLLSGKIECIVPEVIWEVSGIDGQSASGEQAKNGEKFGEDGKNGENGAAGESGGYGAFFADRFEHMERLTFKANGGSGGSGQDGGNGYKGRDGIDGKSMSLAELKENFPSPGRFAGVQRSRALIKSVKKVNELVVKWENDGCSREGINWDTGEMDHTLGTTVCHLQGHTKDNMHIEWGYYASDKILYQKRQVYVLVKGEQGTAGSQGGFGGSGGVGGRGGHAGNLIMRYLNGGNVSSKNVCQMETQNGRDGKDGKDGVDGARGKSGSNGKDVGYMDSMWWGDLVVKGPGTLTTENYTSAVDTCCWCAHHGAWRAIKCASGGRPVAQDSSERQKVSKTKEKVASVKKNAIDSQQMLDSYANELRQNVVNVMKGDTLEFEKVLGEVLEKSHSVLESLSDEELHASESISIVKDSPTGEKDGEKLRWTRAVGKLFQFHKDEQMNAKDVKKKEKSKIELSQSRIQACNAIKQEMTPRWNHHQAQKVTLVKRPTSTKGGASALHALFGKKNAFGFFESQRTRKEVCEKLKALIPFVNDGVAMAHLKDSLKAFFDEEVTTSPVEVQAKKSPTATLDKYCEQYKANPATFLWNKLLQDKKALEDYVEFLAGPSIQFLTSDMLLLAHIYGSQVKLYQCHQGISECFPVDNRDPHIVDVHIAVDTAHEFSRLEEVSNRDLQEVTNKKQRILDDIFSLEKASDVKKYVDKKYFLKPPKEEKVKKEKKVDKKAEEKQFQVKVGQIEAISKLLCSWAGLNSGTNELSEAPRLEKLVVETALHLWPVQALMIFHDKLETLECDTGNQESFHTAFVRITEAVSVGDEVTPLLWILASYSISEWEIEITLLLLEEYFEAVSRDDVHIWRDILTKFPEKLVVGLRKLVEAGTAFKVENTQDFTNWLWNLQKLEINSRMDFAKLDGVGRSQWPYQLRRLYLDVRLKGLPNVIWNDEENKQSQALYYLTALFNEKRDTVLSLLNALESKLATQITGPSTSVTRALANFYGGLWDLDKNVISSLVESYTLSAWMKEMDKKQDELWKTKGLRSLQEIHTLIGNDSNSTVDSDTMLKVVELVKTMKTPALDTDVAKWLEEFQSKILDKGLTKDTLEYQVEAVEMVDLVIRNTPELGYYLRPTQKVAIISALTLTAHGHNLLSQIATGEGKTCIVLAVAIVRGLFGEKTDVVTSSAVLAQRDATAYKDIYESFGLTVGEVTSEIIADRRRAYLCTVCYGEVSNFQRDYLLDRFYSQNIRGNRGHQNLIVDEVDSMFLDKGNSVLYLSHQPPDLSSLESLFVAIWVNVVQAVNSGGSGQYAVAKVKEIILDKIYPSVDMDDLKVIVSNVPQISELLKWLVSNRVITSSTGRILVSVDQLKSLPVLPENLQQLDQRLKYLLQRKLEAPGSIPVMNYLKLFIEHHLQIWINSAFRACQLVEGREYVVDVGHSKTSLDKDPRIMILDLDTGVDLKDSQWNEGLHQFLQLKHGCQLSLLNLKAVFISNISYFKEYPRIFGLTGTIGTESDREFLRTTYNVELLCMPLAQPKRFIEEEPIICDTMQKWKSKVTQEAADKVKKNKSILVVCGTVQEAEVLFSYIKKQLGSKLGTGAIELYRRDYEEFKATVVEEGLATGQILIATNLAGRGTDIKLSRELRDAGGLHVILSYLPDNLRVEQQAFGRASRSGDPGSGRLIFVDNVSSELNSGKDAIDLKILRDEMEMQRVSDIHTYYQMVILKEEEVFKSFRNSFEDVISTLLTVHKNLKDYAVDTVKGVVGAVKNAFVSKSEQEQKSEKVQKMDKLLEGDFKDIKELIMYSMLDEWAYWLDRYSCHLLNEHRKSEQGAKGVFLTEIASRQEENDDKLMQEFMEMTWRYENRMSRYKQPDFVTQAVLKMMPVLGAGAFHGVLSDTSRRTFLESFPQQVFEAYPLELIREPAMITKVAKSMIQRKMPKTAERYLDKVISAEKDSLVAHYYKLVCKLKLGEGKTSSFAQLVDEVEEKLENYKTRQLSYATMIEQFKEIGSQSIFVGDGYRKQKEVVVRLLDMHKGSLDAMVGTKAITGQDFANLCSEHVAEHLIKYFLEEGAVREARFVWTEDSSNLKELADAFCMEVGKVEQILQEFSGLEKGGTQKELLPPVQKELKNRLDLPSRAGFWKEIESCLEEVECFAVVQPEMGVSEQDAQKNEWVNWEKAHHGKCLISKYGTDMGPDSKMLCILRGSKSDFMKDQKFRWLRKIGRLCFEKCAAVNVEKLKSLRLTKYWKIDRNGFTIIEGLTELQSKKIYDILEKSGLVDKDGELISAAEWTEKKPDLTEEFEVWRDDIWRVLHSKCRYKFELLELLKQAEDGKNLRMSLSPRPAKDFVISAMDLGFILGRQVNPSYFPEETAKSFVGHMVTNCSVAQWITWIGKKTGLSGECKALLTFAQVRKAFPNENNATLEEIWKELQEKSWVKPVDGTITKILEWIRKQKKGIQLDLLVSVFPGYAWKILEQLLEAVESTPRYAHPLVFEIDEKGVLENELSEKFQYHQPELRTLLQWRQEFVKENFLKTALEKLCQSQGKLKTLDNPDATLVDIEQLFGTGVWAQQERIQCRQEINTLALNAFEHTIDTVERTYTLKMICSATFIAVFGLAQIALGLWLQTFVGVGTFVGSGLIGEGFGDIMYAYHSFRSGYFSWKDWATHKLGSVITTALMVGVGALIAKGVRYSKYGEKIFGSWGKAKTSAEITKTLAQDAVANIPQRSLFAEGLKSFGYKVAQAAALVGGTAAVSLVYEKALKQFVDTFSVQFFQNAHEAVDKHQVSADIGELVDQVGVDKARRIVGQCRARVLETPRGTQGIEQDAHNYLSQMLAPILGGVQEGMGKMVCAEEAIGQGLMLTAKILKILNVILQAAAYLQAVAKMKDSVNKYLGEIAREIQREKRFAMDGRRGDAAQNVGVGRNVSQEGVERGSLMNSASGNVITREWVENGRRTEIEMSSDEDSSIEGDEEDNSESDENQKSEGDEEDYSESDENGDSESDEEEDSKESAFNKQQLIFEFKEEVHSIIKEKIGGIMRYTIIEPLMNAACQKLLRCVGRFLRGKVRERREANIRKEVEKVLDRLRNEKDVTPQVKKGLRLELVRLCSLSRDPKTIAHVVENGGPLGVETVQAFANKYNVIIEVDSDNPDVPKKYVPENGQQPTKTIKLKHTMLQEGDNDDIGHWSSTSGGREGNASASSSPDCLLDALKEELHAAGLNVDDVNRKGLAEFMRSDENFKDFISNGWHHTYNALGGFGGARRKTPYKWEQTQLQGQRRENTISNISQVRQMHTENRTMVYREGVESENGEPIPDDAKVFTPEEMGCITMLASETVTDADNGEEKEVAKFVQAKVTPEHLRNYKVDKREHIPKPLREQVLKDAGNKEGEFEMGHIIAWVLGGPALMYNFFSQSKKVNNGIDKSLVKQVVRWLKQCGGEVEINTVIERNPGDPFPVSHVSHLVHRVNGEVRNVACVSIVNDADYKYSLPKTEIRTPKRRGPASGA